jgi:sec-independent protein translocase protein TatB
MFDLSFWEIMVIGIVAVIVVGPERLPGLAYKAGQWMTKVRRFIAKAKAEVDTEFNTAELRKLMSMQEEEMQKLRRLVEDTRHDVEQNQHLLAEVIEETAQSVDAAVSPTAAPAQAESPAIAQAMQVKPTSLSKEGAPALATPQATPATSPPTPTAQHVEATLPAMTAQSIEDEMLALSQSLGETLHRPSFGGAPEPEQHIAPTPPQDTPRA